MELRQLKYFVKTAELLNFSEAAKVLYITQSTLSQQIRQLEQELDVALFYRDSHSVILTEGGEQLLPYAIQTLRSATMCADRIRDLKEMLSGSLDIGITYTFAPIITETVLEFIKLYPNVKLHIFYKTMEELLEMLSKRELDFVLAFKPTVHFNEVESHVLFDNDLSVIVNEHHPLAEKESVTLQDILPHSIAMPAKGLQARNAFDTVFPGAFDSLDVKIELNEVNVLLDIVRGSKLLTILSEATIHQSRGLKSIPFNITHSLMEGCVHVHKQAYRKRSAEVFIKMLNESVSLRKRANYWME